MFLGCGLFCDACYYNNTPACTNCQQALGPKGNVFNTTNCAGEQGGDDAEDEDEYEGYCDEFEEKHMSMNTDLSINIHVSLLQMNKKKLKSSPMPIFVIKIA